MSRVTVTVTVILGPTAPIDSSYGGALAVPNKCSLYLQIDKRVNICRGSGGE